MQINNLECLQGV